MGQQFRVESLTRQIHSDGKKRRSDSIFATADLRLGCK